ncbi:DNA (cytosine-5-)-methyltransferase [Mycoplasma sp. NEAQ87857]|uniref:DNA cytosine methyltransferase n=1 Tax=Mycoplasma sp. NEAQ87857 TaxID=2683967 RepID=UPI001318B79B|nr:DNA (cytosine-5-)-methyltransferase [Mycoplasma sp. NEAQ87857]QGZ97816.1 DNA (cytosine-5-)-methyltransferase [Mycoplasma sp. NEAQ87857]
MKTLRVFEAFAGIGAQHKAVKYVNKLDKPVNFKVVAISDWDVRANIAYAAMHHKLTKEKINNIIKKHQINDLDAYFKNKVYSMNSKKPIFSIKKLSPEFKKAIIASSLVTNNHSDINQLKGKVINKLKIDLLTYSFPCQGLSSANMGRDKGINNEKSTSNLVWQIGRVINETEHKPKYLLLENVKTLVKKYNDEYQEWVNYLDTLGYKTFTAIFKASDHGSLQIRERVFALSVLKDIKLPFEENDVAYKEYVNNLAKPIDINKKQAKYLKIFDVDNNRINEAKSCLMNNTPSRIKMVKSGINLSDMYKAKERKYFINTLTTKQDRLPNAGHIPLANNEINKLQYRFITPREAYKIMGFSDKDFDLLLPFIQDKYLNNDCLWRQAGNSIDVNVIKDIFQAIANIEELNRKDNDE